MAKYTVKVHEDNYYLPPTQGYRKEHLNLILRTRGDYIILKKNINEGPSGRQRNYISL